MNTVSSSILSGMVYAETAYEVWEDLKERFAKIDGSRTYNLHREIATLSQGTSTVSEYYTRLKNLWRQKLYQFLMGLNENYMEARRQILLMSPLPSMNKAYAMISGDENQKSISAKSVGLLGAMQTSFGHNDGSSHDPTTMYSRAGHTKENYYKVVGYPPGFKSKRKEHSAYNVYADVAYQEYEPTKLDKQNEVHDKAAVMNARQGAEMVNQMQVRGAPMFSRCQYEQIVKLLNQNVNQLQSSDAAQAQSSANAADSGATNHMVSDVELLDKASVIKATNEKLKLGLTARETTTIPEEEIKLWNLRFGHTSSSILSKLITAQANFVKTQFNKFVKVVRSDNGTKFVNEVCSKMFLESAVYIMNRLPSSTIGMTPYERLYKIKPYISHLKVIGCLCYAKDLTVADKLQSRVKTCVMIGYSKVQKVYIVYDLSNKVFLLNRDVSFRENEFPFKWKTDETPIFVHEMAYDTEHISHQDSFLYKDTTGLPSQSDGSNNSHIHAEPTSDQTTQIPTPDYPSNTTS
ncbi:uncharacterized protein LOC132628396 [Lycium barbarum]|uniref:uncharacterized protein LOC132628396 n=1 Tax=Lycium barbarum TaxID=112863 RepID=UPI00293E20B7|nr:uncharacterized protein LOC132628396 [Lycium barbarum]